MVSIVMGSAVAFGRLLRRVRCEVWLLSPWREVGREFEERRRFRLGSAVVVLDVICDWVRFWPRCG